METITSKRILDTNSTVLVQNYNETLCRIKETIKKNQWRTSKELKELTVEDFAASHKSNNSKKKFRDRLNRVIFHPTRKHINTLTGLDLKISLKEERIQKARKDWKDYQFETERLHKIYKEEKGNFYK